jgi:hypothetical protein
MQHIGNEAQSLSVRLDKLESQNRKWKLATIAFGLTSASLIAMAAKPADHYDPNVIRVRSVEAQEFVLKDDDGQVFARLTLNPKPNISRSGVTLNTEGAALQFYDNKGKPTWTEPGSPSMLPAK